MYLQQEELTRETEMTTTTRPISPRTAIRAYSAASRAVRRLTAQQEAGIRPGYEEIVANARQEQLEIMLTMARHPAVYDLTDAERAALSR